MARTAARTLLMPAAGLGFDAKAIWHRCSWPREPGVLGAA